MHKPDTLLTRYVALSLAVTDAEQAGDLAGEQQALDRFWAFVDRYLYQVDIGLIRAADREHGLEVQAFC